MQAKSHGPNMRTADRRGTEFETRSAMKADVSDFDDAELRWEYQDRMATAFDEVRVLDEMGGQGWELTGFGPFVLHFRRPEDPAGRKRWQHLRIVEFGGPYQRSKLEADGWQHCGSWVVFHYFKRPHGAQRSDGP